MTTPTWESKQYRLVNTLELVSPIPQIPLNVPKKEIVVAKKKEVVLKPSLSARAKKHALNSPEIATALIAKFGNELIIELVSRESGLNPYAKNPNSTACGLFQACPCSKMKCELSDINCQIEWGYNYIMTRYGSVENAWKFWSERGWY